MNKLLIFCKLIFFLLLCAMLSGCPLTVNLNVTTEKPLAVNVIIDKPIELKLSADIAVTKLPPIKANANIDISKLPPIRAKADIDISKLPPIRMGLAHKKTPEEEKTKTP